MVPGIEEALTGMQEGGRRRVLIPPSVGYDPDVKVISVPTKLSLNTGSSL